MRLASDALLAFAALWLLGAVLGLARIAAGKAAKAVRQELLDLGSYAAFGVFFAFVGVIVRLW